MAKAYRAMTDEPEQPDDETPDTEYVDPCISIGDGECWIADADLLIPSDDDALGETD